MSRVRLGRPVWPAVMRGMRDPPRLSRRRSRPTPDKHRTHGPVHTRDRNPGERRDERQCLPCQPDVRSACRGDPDGRSRRDAGRARDPVAGRSSCPGALCRSRDYPGGRPQGRSQRAPGTGSVGWPRARWRPCRDGATCLRSRGPGARRFDDCPLGVESRI